MENSEKLILFDIDGTLVMPYANNILHNRFTFAFNKTFGTKAKIDMADYNGKTLKRIFLDIGKAEGVKRRSVLKNIKRLFSYEKDYIKHNSKTYHNIAIEGALPLLKELKKKGYRLGLVTGNSKYGSIFKLKKCGLDGFFKFGGFGDLSENRERLIADAIKKAERRFRTKLNKKNVFYFGDAPLDIEAGRIAGVRMIAVATGWCTVQELKKYNPDYLLKDLSDMHKVLKIVSS